MQTIAKEIQHATEYYNHKAIYNKLTHYLTSTSETWQRMDLQSAAD